MKVIKFGGKSLANGQGIKQVVSILDEKHNNNEKVIVVLSARGESTDQLESLLELAKADKDYLKELKSFKEYQLAPITKVDLSKEFELMDKLLQGVQLTRDYSNKIKDLFMAQGELMAVKVVSALLNKANIPSLTVDSREFLKTEKKFGNTSINTAQSKGNCISYFKEIEDTVIPIVTGFIATNEQNETTTLGRNGTNYTASLIANYLDIPHIESYSHVDGIYTANPELVNNAKVINHINYNEASELASFGTTLLHNKSISPLIDKNISMRILNTFNKENKGTLISNSTSVGIKSISIQKDVSLITLTGKGLLDKKGIDSRIFSSLSNIDISVGIISQGSSERGISFIVPKNVSTVAVEVLKNEFKQEISINDIQEIQANKDVSVLTIIGQHISNFSSSLAYLKQNKVDIYLINNTVCGNNISLVIPNKKVKKAVNVIHSQIFGAIKTIHIAVIGKGTVGSSFIDQVLASREKILSKKSIDLKIFAIAGSTKVLLNKNGVSDKWKEEIETKQNGSNQTKTIIDFAEENHLENLIAIDNTSSEAFVDNYLQYIENGFDLISSNKIANTKKYSQYKTLRDGLNKHKKQYLYETNVGAGLPIIDTIRILHESGENITRIKGVFSGSLSYLFNSYSNSEKPFSYFLQKAIENGYTEPDPREDLCGNDVARKLLILARELDLENEFEEIEIENLIPESLREVSTNEFLKNIEKIDPHYAGIKQNLEEGYVLRYTGDLSGNLQENKGILKVSLESVQKNSALGNLQGSDSIFEIYTESYKENPITIIGAGAGAEVTARGVFGDLLRISEKK